MNPFRFLAALVPTLFVTLLASPALAHPGHGFADQSPLHFVTSPYHLAVLAGAGAALWFSARFTARKLPRLSLQTLGVLSVIAAGVLWGLRA